MSKYNRFLILTEWPWTMVIFSRIRMFLMSGNVVKIVGRTHWLYIVGNGK